MPNIRRGIFFVLLFVLISGCSEKPQDQNTNPSKAAVTDLGNDIAQLADRFLADSAQTRLVILLSPT